MTASEKNTKTTIWPLVVLGGGPAGMMAATAAAQAGVKVLLVEKNPILGKKLLITGGGRCNVTNNKLVVREMLSQYQRDGKFLFSTFMQHGVEQSIDWFATQQVHLKEENEGRLFPVSDSAQTIKDALANALERSAVTVQTNAVVKSLQKSDTGFTVILQSGEVIQAQRCVVATGGLARPETGSSGEGFSWLESLGHTVVENSFALVPVMLKTVWTRQLSGITLPRCKVTIMADGQKHSSAKGKVLFTHVGVTGPTILNMSKAIGELLAYSSVTLLLDLFPGVDSAAMHEHIQDILRNNANKKVRNALSELLPAAVVKGILEQCEIDPDTQCNSITRVQRTQLIEYLKALPLPVKGLLGKDKAVVSAGGVTLEEVDFKTMQSKVVPGLYLVGDVLNVNRPSGGYSLQLCWSTGAVAGTQSVKSLSSKQTQV